MNQYRQEQLRKDNIYLNEDYSECTEDLRKQLFEQAKEIDNWESLQGLCVKNL